MAKPAKNELVSTYNVLRRVLYNGDTYNAGDTVDMTASAANELIAIGAIAAPAAPVAPAAVPEPKK